MAQKPVSEREIGLQLLNEVVGYAETCMSRRQYILYYFGEQFDPVNGLGADMCDNSVNPPVLKDAGKALQKILNVVKDLEEKFRTKDLIAVLAGKENPVVKSYKLNTSKHFGSGAAETENYWKSVIRQATVQNYLQKDIETYGVLKLTEKGREALQGNHQPFMIAEDREYNLEQSRADSERGAGKAVNTMDEKLFAQLKELRKNMAKKLGQPPYTIFMDASLEDMTLQYPTTVEEVANIYGVGDGKARKFGKEFAAFIKNYVEENGIERMQDMVMKTVAKKGSHKVFIIQSTDKKIDLEDIAKAKNLSMDDLLKEMEQIVYQGTKLNIDYYIDENFDEDIVNDFMEFMNESDSDSMKVLLAEFGDDLSDEEVRMLRIKFISDVAN